MSARPSLLKSAMIMLEGFLPTGKTGFGKSGRALRASRLRAPQITSRVKHRAGRSANLMVNSPLGGVSAGHLCLKVAVQSLSLNGRCLPEIYGDKGRKEQMISSGRAEWAPQAGPRARVDRQHGQHRHRLRLR